MGTRETLRTQLDAVKADLHALQVENRRLKEDRPEQAALLQTETDLTQTREDNVRVTQELTQLKTLYEQLLRGTQEAEAEATPMAERCATLEEEVRQLQGKLAEESEAHAEQKETGNCLRGELENVVRRAEELDERCRQLELEERQRIRDAELEQYRAVDEERRKWEAREARLLRRLDELEKSTQRQTRPQQYMPPGKARNNNNGPVFQLWRFRAPRKKLSPAWARRTSRSTGQIPGPG